MKIQQEVTLGFHPRPHQGDDPPGPAFGEKTPLESIDNLRLTRWGYEKYEASGPRKRGKSAGERKASAQSVPASALPCKAERNERPKGFLFPSAFSLLSRMLCIRIGGSFRRLNRRKSAQRTLLVSPDLTADEIPATGGHRRFVRRARSITVPCLTSAFLQATAGIKMIFPTKQHPLLRVQGGHRPGGDEPQTTACSGNLVCGKISRNEQSPQELRRLRLRKLSTLVGPGVKPQRNLLLDFRPL